MSRTNVIIANQAITGTGAETASRPSKAFGDADTGFYEDSDDHLGVTLGGTSRFFFSGADFTKADGTKYITSASVDANAVGNPELSGQIFWSKLQDGVQGEILYVNSQLKVSGLATGTTGQILQTNGVGSDPSWVAAAAAGITRQYIFSGSAAAGASGRMGAFRVPAGTFGAGQVVKMFGSARGLGAADSIVQVTLSGAAKTTAALTLNSTSDENFICMIAQTQPSNTTETAVHIGQLYSTNTATGAGTDSTDWITKQFWISGSIKAVSGDAKARMELWY